jgi:polar amino acid transport system substrate-binding protein
MSTMQKSIRTVARRPGAAIRKRWLSLVAAIALLTGGVAPARALTLVTEDNPPYNFTADGKPTGLSTEVVMEMAKRAGVPIDIKTMNWDDAYRAGQADKDTCVYSTARLENRENLFNWVAELAINKWAVFGKQDFDKPIKVLADLRKLKIGGIVLDAKVEYLKSNAVTNIREVVRDEENPPRLFLKPDDPKYIDLWVTSYYAGTDIAAKTKAGPVKVVYVLREQPLWLACSPRTDKDVVKKLVAARASMEKDGSHKRIVQVYEKKAGR